jgi:hypothetical protein
MDVYLTRLVEAINRGQLNTEAIVAVVLGLLMVLSLHHELIHEWPRRAWLEAVACSAVLFVLLARLVLPKG